MHRYVYAKQNIKRGKYLRNKQDDTLSRIRVGADKTKREREEDAPVRGGLLQECEADTGTRHRMRGRNDGTKRGAGEKCNN